jgi:hypothetical protein
MCNSRMRSVWLIAEMLVLQGTLRRVGFDECDKAGLTSRQRRTVASFCLGGAVAGPRASYDDSYICRDNVPDSNANDTLHNSLVACKQVDDLAGNERSRRRVGEAVFSKTTACDGR